MLHLLVSKYLVDRQDWPTGHARSIEHLDPLGGGLHLQPLFQSNRERVPVLGPLTRCGKARVLVQLWRI